MLHQSRGLFAVSGDAVGNSVEFTFSTSGSVNTRGQANVETAECLSLFGKKLPALVQV